MGLRDLAKKLVGKVKADPSSPHGPTPHVTPHSPPPGPPAKEGDKPWYLQGQEDLDGWDETNPGEEPGKKNLKE